MKSKIFSAILSGLLIASLSAQINEKAIENSSAAAASAETSVKTIRPKVMTGVEENPDLYALASSLGADTDYFQFANHYLTGVSDEIMSTFKRNFTHHEACMGREKPAETAVKGGACYGMSALQMLVHNGALSPSDIQEGAETLHDITLDENVVDIIAYYQMMQVNSVRRYASKYYFCNNDEDKLVQNLIDYAEKAMAENKYFFITFNLDHSGHAIVGIGAADGQWEYGGKTYNKCILTLDNNHGDETGGAGFDDYCCIFINTDDNSFYFPAYDISNNDTFIDFVTDDETLFSYNGLLKPTDSTNTDVSDVYSVNLANVTRSSYDLTVTANGQAKTYHGKGITPIDLTVNDFLGVMDYDHTYYPKLADDAVFEISVNNIPEEYSKYHFEMAIGTLSSYKSIWGWWGTFDAKAEKDTLSITFHEPGYFSFDLQNDDGKYKGTPFCYYTFEGVCDKTASITERSDGILLETDSGFAGFVTFTGLKTMEDGSLSGHTPGSPYQKCYITSTGNVLLAYDEEADLIRIYRDPDGDDIYDTEVEKGDVNCDGFIDAVDASLVLNAYAELSVDEYAYFSGKIDINQYTADYNGDGMIDAIDASQILAKYAELSTVKENG